VRSIIDYLAELIVLRTYVSVYVFVRKRRLHFMSLWCGDKLSTGITLNVLESSELALLI
jgi:hypothetical protein